MEIIFKSKLIPLSLERHFHCLNPKPSLSLSPSLSVSLSVSVDGSPSTSSSYASSQHYHEQCLVHNFVDECPTTELMCSSLPHENPEAELTLFDHPHFPKHTIFNLNATKEVALRAPSRQTRQRRLSCGNASLTMSIYWVPYL